MRVTEHHNGDGRNGYFLSRLYPIQSITSIHESTATPRSYTATELVDSDEYGFDGETGKVYLLSSLSTRNVWTIGYDTIQFVLRPGYANAAAVPDDLVDAAYSWTRHIHLRREQAREGVRSVNAADGSVSYESAGMPADVKEMLSPWAVQRFSWLLSQS